MCSWGKRALHDLNYLRTWPGKWIWNKMRYCTIRAENARGCGFLRPKYCSLLAERMWCTNRTRWCMREAYTLDKRWLSLAKAIYRTVSGLPKDWGTRVTIGFVPGLWCSFNIFFCFLKSSNSWVNLSWIKHVQAQKRFFFGCNIFRTNF